MEMNNADPVPRRYTVWLREQRAAENIKEESELS